MSADPLLLSVAPFVLCALVFPAVEILCQCPMACVQRERQKVSVDQDNCDLGMRRR